MISRKTKIAISIGIIFILVVGGCVAKYIYNNHKNNKMEQIKEQMINEQIEIATDKVKNIVDNKISNVECEAKYECNYSSNEDIIITATLNGEKNTSIEGKFKRSDNYVEFYNKDEFKTALDQYISQEKIKETKSKSVGTKDGQNNKTKDTKYYNNETSTSKTSAKSNSNSQITADEAKQLILNEDGNYISKLTNNKDQYGNYDKFTDQYKEYDTDNMPGSEWNISKEPCYEFVINHYNEKGESLNGTCEYLVGKESKKVYCMPNQGGMSAYQIKNNKVVKTFKSNYSEISHEWRK